MDIHKQWRLDTSDVPNTTKMGMDIRRYMVPTKETKSKALKHIQAYNNHIRREAFIKEASVYTKIDVIIKWAENVPRFSSEFVCNMKWATNHTPAQEKAIDNIIRKWFIKVPEDY